MFVASRSRPPPELYLKSLEKRFLFPGYIERDKSAISKAVHSQRRVKNANEKLVSADVRRKRLLPLLFRGKYEWPKHVRSRDCDRRHTLIVLLSLMIYDGRPRKGTSLNPGSPAPIYLRYLQDCALYGTLRTP